MLADRGYELISAFAGKRLLVLGDVMLDRFVYGRINRMSPEAPVPVLLTTREIAMPGGAANVARNIASLGGVAIVVGLVGEDEAGRELRAALAAQGCIECDLVVAPEYTTVVKTRFIAEQQQVVRVDREKLGEFCDQADRLLEHFNRCLANVDAVILSDYAKGVFSDGVMRRAIAAARAVGKPVLVDPKNVDFARYDGATIVTPNLGEAIAASGRVGHDDTSVEAMAGVLLAAAPAIKAVLITRGADGMTLAERGTEIQHLSVAVREVSDVSGAGDTVAATLGLSLAAGASFREAAELANLAAGVVVGKHGTANVSADELAGILAHKTIDPIVAKQVTIPQAERIATMWRMQGLKVGFTNGCFDLIHPGHISLLVQAKAQCDRLIVAINSDDSVKRLKGPTRPIQNEAARAVVLGALTSVDLVVQFADDTPLSLIELLQPDVLVKGADYTIDKVVGADVVTSYGGRVVLVDLTVGESTTGIVSRIEGPTG